MPYIPNTDQNRKEMLARIGAGSFEDLLKDIPASVRLKKPLNLPSALSELDVTNLLRELSLQNQSASEFLNFLGGGSYDHFIPAAVDQIISRSEYYTAYTPYQAEASQGTLQAIYEFQSLICELTGMDVANASLYDGGSALAEAVLLAMHQTERKKILVPANLHPFYKQVLKTYLTGQAHKLVEIPHHEGGIKSDSIKKEIDSQTAAVIIQNPNFFGVIEQDVAEIEKTTHATGALLIMVADPISLGILKAPGEYNADIAVGEGQSLGNRLNLGGPYLGYFACKKEFLRRVPGRMIGVTTDAKGQRGFVMTLQTREQHIRREKATSNICTNQGLMALCATVYLSLLGKQGIKEVANLCLQKAHYAAKRIEAESSFKLKFKAPFFKEFVLESTVAPKKIVKSALKEKIWAGIDLSRFKLGLDSGLLCAVTEKRSKSEIDRLAGFFKNVGGPVAKANSLPKREMQVN